MLIRDMEYRDTDACISIVEREWGLGAAMRAAHQTQAMFEGRPPTGMHIPHFYVAEDGNSLLGFAGFVETWLMPGNYDFIWIALRPDAQGKHLGSALTWKRINEVIARGGSVINLSTQKPLFFERFGFQTLCEHDGWTKMALKVGKVAI